MVGRTFGSASEKSLTWPDYDYIMIRELWTIVWLDFRNLKGT